MEVDLSLVRKLRHAATYNGHKKGKEGEADLLVETRQPSSSCKLVLLRFLVFLGGTMDWSGKGGHAEQDCLCSIVGVLERGQGTSKRRIQKGLAVSLVAALLLCYFTCLTDLKKKKNLRFSLLLAASTRVRFVSLCRLTRKTFFWDVIFDSQLASW